MWIVLFALRYKYTIGVFAILIMLFGVMSARKMSTDILPRVDSPEIMLVWTYNGLNPTEMASKITSFSEIATLNSVDDLVDVRSETLNGVGLVKLRFQSYVDINTALSQVTSVSQTILRRMPTGTTPPLIIRTSPSSVPILQLVMSSDSMTDGQLYDYARLTLRGAIQDIPGLRLTLPYGGAARQVMVDLNPDALNAFGLSAADISRTLGTQNLTLPSGSMREGNRELPVTMNASPETVQAFLDLPIRSVNGKMILLRDVANVRDGEAVSTNPARLDGQNAVMVSILKLGNASTVDVVDAILKRLDKVQREAPPGMKIAPIFDQSVFVKSAVDGVLKEILLVGGLVALVVLLFLGSWRSTLIVLTSIPLALLCSIMGLYLAGATFNLMTLGGLSLAIGILVDNALVEIENIKRQITLGKTVHQAIIDGARQVAFPEFVSTLSICIVFLPIFLLSGTASYVFRPLALAVVFSMIASYLLSRTLVPTLASLLMPAEVRRERELAAKPARRFGLFRIHHGIEHGVDRLAERQGGILRWVFSHRWVILVPVLVAVCIGVFSGIHAGKEFFPRTDAGLMRLFVRMPTGGRVEDTGATIAEIQREIRTIIPKQDLSFIVENIGAPYSVNMAYVETTAISSSDGEILVQLAEKHQPTAQYEAAIRELLSAKFPKVQAFFRPADATSQTLASGSPTTFEIRYIGRDVPYNLKLANELKERFAKVTGVVDITLREVLDQPAYLIRVDRARAAYLGVTQQDAANAVLAALGTGGTVTPSFWADPDKGASYDVQILAQPSALNSTEQLLNLPIRPSAGGEPVLLRAFASLVEYRAPASVSRTTLKPTLTIVANVQGRDLGSVTTELNKILDEQRKRMEDEKKVGTEIVLAGQAALMTSAYSELIGGLGLAAVLVFLVMVINFQSWSLPFVAISGLPMAVSGAMAGLYFTHTPMSVPALMGVIMVVGVSTANSVLVSSFARDLQVLEGVAAAEAALEAATTRLRPVLMTALAMILGVIPMALGHGEGGEQNAPLGRAVIGGLIFGTFASLFVVPTMFAIVRRRWTAKADASDTITLQGDVEPTPEPA